MYRSDEGRIFYTFFKGGRKFLVVFSRSEQEQAEKFKDV